MKDLEYYMGLPYIIELKTIPEEEGGGFIACIPQLGRHAYTGDGDTIEDAIESLSSIKRHFFEKDLKAGIPIPEPEEEINEEYSGRFVIRMPIILHAELSKQAKKNKCSLNQYAVTLLSAAVIARGLSYFIEDEALKIDKVWFGRALEGFQYSFSEHFTRVEPPAPKLIPVISTSTHSFRKTG